MIYLFYHIFGILITFMCIFFFRKDGKTNKKYELYFAAFAPLIWPVVLILFIIDI
jgi:hypothetical protein